MLPFVRQQEDTADEPKQEEERGFDQESENKDRGMDQRRDEGKDRGFDQEEGPEPRHDDESGFVVMNGVNRMGKYQGISGRQVSLVTLVLGIAAVAVCASMKALWDCRLKELKRLNLNGSYQPLLRFLTSDNTESTPLISSN